MKMRLMLFFMVACLAPAAWGERIRSTGTREAVSSGVDETTGEPTMFRTTGAGILKTSPAAASAPTTVVGSTGDEIAKEAKQNDLNALTVIIDAVLDAIKLDTANLTSDPATATLQSDLNALTVIIDSVLDAIKLDTANLTADPATATLQTAIDAVLDAIKLDTANISSDQSTATLQTTGNAILVTIDDVLDDMKLDTANISSDQATGAKQDTGNTNTLAIELNTDSPTTPASGTVSVTTTATSILAADPNRRSALVRNADSNTVLFLGFTSGVTTANGLPVGSAGASGATGNGGTVIYTHTGAIWGIVASGTADVRFQTESD